MPLSKVSSGRQPQLALDFAGINGVAEVVAGTIGHEGDQVCVGVNTLRFFRSKLLQQCTNGFDNLQVRKLVMTADVVGLADVAVGRNA